MSYLQTIQSSLKSKLNACNAWSLYNIIVWQNIVNNTTYLYHNLYIFVLLFISKVVNKKKISTKRKKNAQYILTIFAKPGDLQSQMTKPKDFIINVTTMILLCLAIRGERMTAY